MAITTLGDNFRVIIEGGAGARFAGLAEASANASTIDADRAESARDIAQAAVGVDYADAAAALAGATNGDKFTYWDGDEIIYSTKTGGVLVELGGPWFGADKIGLPRGGTVGDAITWATPAMYGAVGDGVADDTQKLRDMFASGHRKFDLGNGKTYKVSLVEGTFLGKFTGGDVDIIGENCTIHDVSPGYTNNGALTPMIWGEATQRLSCVGVNYEGPVIATPDTLLGYQGATFVRVTDGAKNTHVEADLVNIRYGIQSGEYTDWTKGGCSGFSGRITGSFIGYPLALYLASDIDFDVHATDFHRLGYYAGCSHIKGTLRGKDQHIAAVFSLITDAKTSATTSFGCLDYQVKTFDEGSTAYVAGARVVGIIPSWSFDGTTYEDIDLHAHIVSSDTVASKLGHAAIYATGGVDWKATQKLINVRVSGVLDRSAQTTTEQDTSGEIYVNGYSGVLGSGIWLGIEDFSVEGFTYKPGSGSKPRGFRFLMPGLVGSASVKGVNFADAPVYYGTSATSKTVFENCTLLGSYPAGNDSPYLSNITFINCAITNAADQPSTNKYYLNTLTQGGGATVERLTTVLTLTGASVTWSNSLPNNSVILGVSGRVTEAITGATGFLVGVTGTTNRFHDSGVQVAAGSTFGPANSAVSTVPIQVGTGSIVVTAKTSNFTAGKLRVFVDFIRITPPIS